MKAVNKTPETLDIRMEYEVYFEMLEFLRKIRDTVRMYESLSWYARWEGAHARPRKESKGESV